MPLVSLLHAQLWEAGEANSLFARTEDGCCSLSCWGSLDPCARFPHSFSLNPCKVKRNWHLTMSNVLQKRNLNSTGQLSDGNKLL